MSKAINAFKIKEHRNNIMANMAQWYPTPCKTRNLYNTLCGDPTYNKTLFEKDMMLLHQEGYLEYLDDEFGGSDAFENKVCRLTADGKKVTEGTQTDPALEI